MGLKEGGQIIQLTFLFIFNAVAFLRKGQLFILKSYFCFQHHIVYGVL